MKQLNYFGKGKLAWVDTPPPALVTPGDVIVRPFAAARCDVETAFFRHDLSPLIRLGISAHVLSPGLLEAFGNKPFAGPIPVGHECIAQVTATGEDVKRHGIGDIVVVPYQISCGVCSFCSRGKTAHCSTDRPSPISAFGGFADPKNAWGGTFSDSVRIPFADHMLVPFPAELDPVSYASAGDNMVDAYRSVADPLEQVPGAPVLVVGGRARSIGLYAVAMASALGSEEVVYVDWDNGRLETAEKLGARVMEGSFGRLAGDSAIRRKFPISVEASGKATGLNLAMSALDVCGMCAVVALHWGRSNKLPLWDMYMRNLTMTTGMVDARMVIPKLLELGRTGKLNARPVISTVASWSDAPEALIEKCSKVVVHRPPLELAT